MVKVNKKNNKGFTLVELLAVLAILSIVITIVITVSMIVVNNSKEKSYKVTINNIENEAGNYVIENEVGFSWRPYNIGDRSFEYQCVTVGHLIDKGYFKGDVLDSYVNNEQKVETEDYIYLERNENNKNVEKKILLYDEEIDNNLFNFCENATSQGSISYKISPSGWAREKTVTIKYRLYNNLDSVTDDKYTYYYNNYETNEDDSHIFNKNIEEVTLNVTSVGKIFPKILLNGADIVNETINVTNIDRVKPVIKENYSGNTKVVKSVTIPIIVNDKESGVNTDSFITEDVSVFVGETKINDFKLKYKKNVDKDYYYDLTINNNDRKIIGPVKIVIGKDKVLDNAGNTNDAKTLTPKVEFSNLYTIKYKANGGKGTMSDTECVYGETCKISANGFMYDGHTFVGWTTKSDGADDGYGWTNFNGTWNFENGNKGVVGETLTLYARWRNNRVYVKFDTAGGTIKSTGTWNGKTFNWTTSDNGIISRQSGSSAATNKFFFIEYGSDKKLPAMNGDYMNITRNGYKVVSKKEWICEAECITNGKIFDQNVYYNASDFCDAKNGDCTVAVGVNWTRNLLTKYITAKSGLNCRTSKSTANKSNIKKAYSCGTKIVGYFDSSDWFYYVDGGCYFYAPGYIADKKASCGTSTTPTPSSPPSGGGGSSSGGGDKPAESGKYCVCSKSSGKAQAACGLTIQNRDDCVSYCYQNGWSFYSYNCY